MPTELGWEERNKIGMAIFVATDGSKEGFKIWNDWLKRSGKYNEATARQRWAAITKYPPSKTGYEKLSCLATKAHPKWLSELDKKLIRELNRG